MNNTLRMMDPSRCGLYENSLSRRHDKGLIDFFRKKLIHRGAGGEAIGVKAIIIEDHDASGTEARPKPSAAVHDRRIDVHVDVNEGIASDLGDVSQCVRNQPGMKIAERDMMSEAPAYIIYRRVPEVAGRVVIPGSNNVIWHAAECIKEMKATPSCVLG